MNEGGLEIKQRGAGGGRATRPTRQGEIRTKYFVPYVVACSSSRGPCAGPIFNAPNLRIWKSARCRVGWRWDYLVEEPGESCPKNLPFDAGHTDSVVPRLYDTRKIFYRRTREYPRETGLRGASVESLTTERERERGFLYIRPGLKNARAWNPNYTAVTPPHKYAGSDVGQEDFGEALRRSALL